VVVTLRPKGNVTTPLSPKGTGAALLGEPFVCT